MARYLLNHITELQVPASGPPEPAKKTAICLCSDSLRRSKNKPREVGSRAGDDLSSGHKHAQPHVASETVLVKAPRAIRGGKSSSSL
ncbi:hypothetical protein RRG08_017037 [Elysia crispata]|uniref:Uncharacterized protein n=1 Tax=Elysia crispata TaxID=231223 RepID=A0AAE0XYY5_9GAST|nr:hypothetical protein RRG08_017037 [Elysia crispata]